MQRANIDTRSFKFPVFNITLGRYKPSEATTMPNSSLTDPSATAFVDLHPQPAIIVNASLAVLHSNPAFQQRFAAPVAENPTPAMTSLQKISADETLQAAIGHVCATGELQRCAVRMWDKHGECVPVEVYCMPFQHGGQPGCMCFFHLPGVEQPAEEERSLNSFKSRLYAMLVHDFKTPLSVIKMTVGNLESHFDKIDARRRENMFRLIKQSADELTEFVSDLEMINTARSTGLSVHYQQVDVHELCTTTFEEIQAYCNGSHNLTLALPEQPVGLRVDKHLLARALRNLLTNALKFSPKGSHIRLEMLRAEGDILLQVHDQGMGIPEHDRERVFETFYRARNVGAIGGSGLGLALVKYAVLQQGGSIEVDSAEGVGTTITLRFPASPG